MANGIYIQAEYRGKLIRKIVCNGEERWFIGSDCDRTVPHVITWYAQIFCGGRRYAHCAPTNLMMQRLFRETAYTEKDCRRTMFAPTEHSLTHCDDKTPHFTALQS